jgi:hypothetical protein
VIVGQKRVACQVGRPEDPRGEGDGGAPVPAQQLFEVRAPGHPTGPQSALLAATAEIAAEYQQRMEAERRSWGSWPQQGEEGEGEAAG